MQRYSSPKDSSVIGGPEPFHEPLAWIWLLGVAVNAPQEIKGCLMSSQKKQMLKSYWQSKLKSGSCCTFQCASLCSFALDSIYKHLKPVFIKHMKNEACLFVSKL